MGLLRKPKEGEKPTEGEQERSLGGGKATREAKGRPRGIDRHSLKEKTPSSGSTEGDEAGKEEGHPLFSSLTIIISNNTA